MAQNYTIELVERWVFLNAQGNPVDGYRVTFYIPDLDITDHILISEKEYGTGVVKNAIEDKIAVHKAIMGE